MSAAIQEFITLLTRPPGNLIYHVIVAYSAAAALPSAMSLWRVGGYSQGRRTVIGLATILLAWLALFLLGGLSWQGLIPEHNLLPPLDRGVTLLSLILVAWLWAFPEPHRLADAVTLLTILFTLTLCGLNIAWWHSQGVYVGYNGLPSDRIAQGYAGFLALVGIVILVLRRPSGWTFGFSMLGLLLLGHVGQLLLPAVKGDYAGLVRLTQVAAFPILLALPQRIQMWGAASGLTVRRGSLSSPPTGNAALVQDALNLALQTDPAQIGPAAVRLIAQSMLADVCVLITSPDTNSQMSVLYGYDLIREKHIEGINLDGREATAIASALRHAEPLRLLKSANTIDQIKLAQALNLEKAADLLFVPATDVDGMVVFGIALFTPYTNKSWGEEDQALLSAIARSLAQLLQQSRRLTETNSALDKMQQSFQAAQIEIDDLRQERQSLLAQLENSAGLIERQPVEADEIESFLTAQQKAQSVILRLQEEIKQMRQAEQPSPQTPYFPEEAARQQTLESELKLALEEIARLRTLLSVSDETKGVTQPPAPIRSNDQRFIALTNLIQDLRQPLSSVTGYTEFLLGESIGILGALQRKFLERIKQATERMNATLDQISTLTGQERAILQLKPEPVHLSQIISQVIRKTSDQLRNNQIALQVDMPEKLPDLMADPDTLEQALINLLENAGRVTPPEGKITLKVSLQREEAVQEFVLIQITDQGGGIDPQELSKVFSPDAREPIQGIGDTGAAMSVLKTMVESLGGRMWVESQPSSGAVFSVLMPVMAAQAIKDTNGGVWN